MNRQKRITNYSVLSDISKRFIPEEERRTSLHSMILIECNESTPSSNGMYHILILGASLFNFFANFQQLF